MLAALTRIFGVRNLALAEDVVQDAFCRALEVWKLRGIPENPSAWLMAAAKNRAIDALRRERTARTFAPELGRELQSEWTLAPTVTELFKPHALRDDRLRMMFSCCHPRLPEQTQVALVLSLLCGFSVGEIASAFLSTGAATAKRLGRAKKVLAGSKKLFDLSDRDFSSRLAAVQRALYLLFNEGYHGASAESVVRAELCREAMRLAALLLENKQTSTPAAQALYALMCFHAARLPARIDAAGNLTTLYEQDRSLWVMPLVAKGKRFMDLSATGPELTEYHIEAAIGSVHAQARSADQTNWSRIVSLYDALMRLRPSPVVALNRAIAVAQCEGPERGLAEVAAIENCDRLAAYPFYQAALGELELRSGRIEAAREHFRSAAGLARNLAERRFMQQRMAACEMGTQ